MHNYLTILKKAHKKFPTHKRIHIRLKENPTNPFNSLYIDKFIENKEFPNYTLYIHDWYFTIYSQDLINFEPLRIPIDKKLWIEIYCSFDFVKILN